ncbi:tannase and feruloyl esterase [Sporormia fimetaria CBS 119925]|uniref:Carboxylic ester hydrolase n=1 Tax=Sporormia fimetaria CBS 119925 TaxID=1340428 RepID=A0A6A6V0T8_9PLEO|nr:tannase and feruloyl esterase [Sporormia fimetaria CBS 119925]
MFGTVLALALFGTALVTGTQEEAFQKKCLSFKPESLVKGATRNVLEFVPAGTILSFPDNDPTCNRGSQLVSRDLCRIALNIETSGSSSITFEAWLPDDWSGRFLATGNGGIDGCIKYEDLAYGSANAFATVGANNGKNGTSGEPFFNNPGTVIDFAWRSLHTSVEAGKKLSKHFFKEDYTKSYYLGCSLGGRQGIKSAEKFPGDFDGIVAGAPAVDFNNLVSWRARFFTITGHEDSLNFIPAEAWKTWIHDEVIRQCDTLDKAADGIIEDASKCHFDPSTLLCSAGKTEKCLNMDQLQQLNTIFADYTFPSGELIFPAMQPGSEVNAIEKLYAGTPFGYSDDWFKYVVHNDPTWDASTFDLDDVRAAERLNPGDIRTYPSSLPPFERRGGKLLMYHGQQDNQITTLNTDRFFKRLQGRRSQASMDEWVRYFRISGMNHCNSGPGAWVLGQGGNAAQKGIGFDRERNVLKAMVDWVEKGVAPEFLEGTKFVTDNVELGVDFTRRHCMFPKSNVFVGNDVKDAGSWNCQ